jgi:hypothetical protein
LRDSAGIKPDFAALNATPENPARARSYQRAAACELAAPTLIATGMERSWIRRPASGLIRRLDRMDIGTEGARVGHNTFVRVKAGRWLAVGLRPFPPLLVFARSRATFETRNETAPRRCCGPHGPLNAKRRSVDRGRDQDRAATCGLSRFERGATGSASDAVELLLRATVRRGCRLGFGHGRR